MLFGLIIFIWCQIYNPCFLLVSLCLLHFLPFSHLLFELGSMGLQSQTWQRDWTTRRQWHPTPVLLPGKSHGRRSLVGCSPWGREESDMTERLHFHFSLSCIGEGNGNTVQCSCLENPRDGGAWWAAIHGVAQGQTRLKRLCCSSNTELSFPYESVWMPFLFGGQMQSILFLYMTFMFYLNSVILSCVVITVHICCSLVPKSSPTLLWHHSL